MAEHTAESKRVEAVRLVARGIVLESQRVLLVKHRDATFWAPAGGTALKDETLHCCLKRELVEELGLEVEIIRLLYHYEYVRADTRHIHLIWLVRPATTDALVINRAELSDARWFTQQELDAVTVYPKELQDVFWSEPSVLAVRKGCGPA